MEKTTNLRIVKMYVQYQPNCIFYLTVYLSSQELERMVATLDVDNRALRHKVSITSAFRDFSDSTIRLKDRGIPHPYWVS